MKTVYRRFLLLSMLFALAFTVNAQSFDRRAMLEGLVTETILPLHETLEEQSVLLMDATAALAVDPTEETLTAAQEAWFNTSIAFEHVEIYKFRRLMPYITQIDSAPTDTAMIESHLADNTEIPPEFAQGIGSSSKGLPALEYLLYADGALDTLTEDAHRRDYAAAVAVDIHLNAAELVAQWATDGTYGSRFIDADGELSSVRSSMSMIVNEMIAELEDIGQFWIGGSLGYRDGGIVQPEQVGAPYSNTSIEKLIANLEGFQMALNGLGDAPSLADYVDFLGATYEEQPMSTALNEQADRAIAALEALETPLQVAVVETPNDVEIAYAESVMLLQMVQTDMASQLGITVTFSDNDGD